MLNDFPRQSGESPLFGAAGTQGITGVLGAFVFSMRIAPLTLLLLLGIFAATPARAVLHITRDHGGYVEEYKAKYKRVRDSGERVVIDGICNSACTLVFGIVPDLLILFSMGRTNF